MQKESGSDSSLRNSDFPLDDAANYEALKIAVTQLRRCYIDCDCQPEAKKALLIIAEILNVRFEDLTKKGFFDEQP